MRRASLLLSLIFCLSGFAGYRVYELKIEEYDVYGKLERVNKVMSTLDHLQYEHYYGGYGLMRVSLMDTWFCPGDTSHFRPYCRKPQVKEQFISTPEGRRRVPLPYNRQPVIP